MEVLGLTEGKEAEQPTVDVSHIVDRKKMAILQKDYVVQLCSNSKK